LGDDTGLMLKMDYISRFSDRRLLYFEVGNMFVFGVWVVYRAFLRWRYLHLIYIFCSWDSTSLNGNTCDLALSVGFHGTVIPEESYAPIKMALITAWTLYKSTHTSQTERQENPHFEGPPPKIK
jgi:hypothetical protein